MIPTLKTKFYIPHVRPDLVPRPRLIEQLDWGLRTAKLTLISAPAGSGKTTLLSSWIASHQMNMAWLSLDSRDNDLSHYLVNLVAALQSVNADIGRDVLGMLQSPEIPSLQVLLTLLVNDLAEAYPDRSLRGPLCVLVLDDYHVIDDAQVHQSLAFLLDHSPPQFHLVLLTREDPPLPLPRLRAQQQISQIRASDLRFTLDETAELFHRAMGLQVSDADLKALEARTEGWIAGLQLAGLALRGLPMALGEQRVSRFIQSFAGSHRFVLDYLVEEVLHQQEQSVQSFLLCTSILDRLCSPLCDAVWAVQEGAVSSPSASEGDVRQDSQTLLEYLERANLFLVSLDDERRYYRYHHLFRDMLRHRLQRGFPDSVSQLHARAADWLAEYGDPSAAFDHWIAAGDPLSAAQVVEKYGHRYLDKADYQQLSHWLQRLPAELVEASPWLCVFQSWNLMFTGRFEEADAHLTLAERNLGLVSDQSDADLREQYGYVAATRAALASRSQDGEGILHYGGLALKYVSPDRRAIRGYVAFALCTGRYYENQYDLARESWRQASRLNVQAGNTMLAVNCLVALAELYRVQGKLQASLRVCDEAGMMATDEQGHPLPVLAEVLVAKARLYYEWGDFAAVEENLARAKVHMKLYTGFDLRVEYNACLSGLRLAQGQSDQALALIQEIESSDRQPFYKSAAVFLACRINHYLTVGDLATVEHILRQEDWDLERKNMFAWADALGAYARVLIYQGELARADDLLELCRARLEGYGLWTPVIKSLILQSCIAEQRGNSVVAQAYIERALTLAEPDRFVRAFLDVGQLIREPLARAEVRRVLPGYTRMLLTALETEAQGCQASPVPTVGAKPQPLVESLSPRELEVLRLVAQGLSNREIADRLFLALPTVKGHNREIYAKLQVHRRTEAVARARELGLL